MPPRGHIGLLQGDSFTETALIASLIALLQGKVLVVTQGATGLKRFICQTNLARHLGEPELSCQVMIARQA